MIKRVVLIGVVVAVIATFSLSRPAYAHHVVEDTNTGMQASFHITPDHDPIAGEESVISFDFAQTDTKTEDYTYSLTVTSTQTEATEVPLDIPGNVVITSYTFPVQGLYDIKLTATHKESGTVSRLEYGQRVARGATVERSTSFTSVEIGAMAVAVLILIVGIMYSLVNNNKREVQKNGTKNHK
jgi:hypothetical protein